MFSPMLSKDVDLNKLVFPVLVSPKYDGIRCVMYKGKTATRTLKPIPNIYTRTRLETELGDCGLDGELVIGSPTAHNCMQTTSSGIMSHTGKPDFTYYVFDYINDSYIEDKIPFFIRLDVAKYICEVAPSFVKFVEHHLIDNIDQLLTYEEFIVSIGYEGIMVRKVDGHYKAGRSTVNEGLLLKMKRFIDEEAFIIGFEEKLHNANIATIDPRGYTIRGKSQDNMVPADTLGAIVVYSDRWGEFNIGSGFDDTLRNEIWDNQDKYIGKQVTFKYQKHGCKDKPRAPIFRCFREDM